MSARAQHVAPLLRGRAGRLLLRPLLLVLSFATAMTPALRAQASQPMVARPRIGPAFGLHVGVPQKVSLALGVARWRTLDGDDGDALFALAEPGLGAGRASVGYLRSRGNLGTGLAVRASALRTWRDPWSVAPNRTFVGLEGSAHLFFFNIRAGAFHRTTAATGNAFLVTVDGGLFL